MGNKIKKTNLKLGEMVRATKKCKLCLAEKGWVHLYKECFKEVK
jgi:hypothetical protein